MVPTSKTFPSDQVVEFQIGVLGALKHVFPKERTKEPARYLVRNTSKSITHIPGISLQTCIIHNSSRNFLRNFQIRSTSTLVHSFVRFTLKPQPTVDSTIQRTNKPVKNEATISQCHHHGPQPRTVLHLLLYQVSCPWISGKNQMIGVIINQRKNISFLCSSSTLLYIF